MKSLHTFLFGTSVGDHSYANLGVLVLRAGFGLSIALAHGLGKVPPPEMFVNALGGMGFPCPACFAWLAGLSEFLGGLCIAFGLLTRPAASFLGFTMAVAAFVAHASDPFQKKEMALLYLTASFAILLLGGGRHALDKFFRR